MQKHNNGFTLVELIVVLAILAIFAAIGIPAMLGFIDYNRERRVLMNEQSAYTVAQTLVRERYGQVEEMPTVDEVNSLADLPGTVTEIEVDADEGRLAENAPFQYEEDGIIVIYSNGDWKASGGD